MYKIFVPVLSGCLFSFALLAQTNDLKQVLYEIKKNNKELISYQSFIDSRRLDNKASNNLPDPQASFYYLPFGKHTRGNYTEFQVLQSFEFPSVYGARKKWIDKQDHQLQYEYEKLQQDILLTAKKHCIEIISLNKRKQIEEQRMNLAKKIFDQEQELFEKEAAGILDLNKAKIAWLQNQFKLEQIENDKKNILISLARLNGGDNVSFEQESYPGPLTIASMESIWQEKMSADPALMALNEMEEVVLQNIKLKKNEALPDLIAGYNYQGIPELHYSGIYAGLSIPVWNNKNRIKTAKAQHIYQKLNTEAVTNKIHSGFLKQYNRYQLLLRKFREYQTTLDGLNTDTLLYQAYELGDISFMEYYIELQFYRQAYDKMMQVEYDLYRFKAELLKHTL